jgi:hypothetical protein
MGGSQVAASQYGLSCQKKFPACLQYTLPSSLIQQMTLQINSQRMIKKLSPTDLNDQVEQFEHSGLQTSYPVQKFD